MAKELTASRARIVQAGDAARRRIERNLHDGAFQALAARAPVPVELVATPGERLPHAVEATAYYIVAESLTNVAKYAEASAVTVSVRQAEGRLLVEVRDDGVGGADVARGSGLRGLADRAEALRGTLSVTSSPGGGTAISAVLPLGRAG